MASLSLLNFPSLSSPLNRPSSSPSSFPFTSTRGMVPTPFSNCRNPSSSSPATAYRFSSGDAGEDDHHHHHHHHASADSSGAFREAVALFNGGDYYKCHDVLESLWNDAEDPARTLIHGILQCAVGFHHLFNQNHRGAMMELGEGLCKLRKMNFEGGPFLRFEQEISALLDFIYLTQLELAACTDDFCIALDQSERSYQLLGGYAAGQHLYCLERDSSETKYIVFCPERSYETGEPPRVKLPTLNASAEHLKEFEYDRLH